MAILINHPEYRCGGCEGTSARLYHCTRDDGYNFQVVHACEHVIRGWYPDAPADLDVFDALYWAEVGSLVKCALTVSI